MNTVAIGSSLRSSLFLAVLLVSGCGIWVGGDGGHVHMPPPLDRMEIIIDDTIGPDLPTEKKGMKPEDRGSYYGFAFRIFNWECGGHGCKLTWSYDETRP